MKDYLTEIFANGEQISCLRSMLPRAHEAADPAMRGRSPTIGMLRQRTLTGVRIVDRNADRP